MYYRGLHKLADQGLQLLDGQGMWVHNLQGETELSFIGPLCSVPDFS